MNLEQYVIDYTYWVAFLAAIIEGEMILLAVGAAVALTDLSLPTVILISFIGAALHDQTLFYVGRYFGHPLFHKYPILREKVHRIFTLVEKYDIWFILGFRFVYGVRTVTPIALGLTHISQVKYTGFTLFSAFVWAAAVVSVGYFGADFGRMLLERFCECQSYILAGGGGVIAVGVAIYYLWRRRQEGENVEE